MNNIDKEYHGNSEYHKYHGFLKCDTVLVMAEGVTEKLRVGIAHLFGRKTNEPTAPPVKKSLPELISQLRIVQGVASSARSTGSSEITIHFLRKVESAEQELIDALEDPFQQEVFRLLARQKFDLTHFIDETNEWRWVETLRGGFREIITDLIIARDINKEEARNLYLEMLQRTKGVEPEMRLVEQARVVEQEDNPGVGFATLIPILFGQGGRKNAVFVGIINLPGGEEFIRNQLLEPTSDSPQPKG